MNIKRPPVTLFWFRRDLRLADNAGLYEALKAHTDVLPLFIFDEKILRHLPADDLRVVFIHQQVEKLQDQLRQMGSDLLVRHGDVLDVFRALEKEFRIAAIYANHDYEPAAVERDEQIKRFAESHQVAFLTFKDQCIFEKKEILTDQQKNYTVYTPYKKKWLASLSPFYLKPYPTEKYQNKYFRTKDNPKLISLKDLGFQNSKLIFPSEKVDLKILKNYQAQRDFPAVVGGTSHLGIHLRFGTVSVRALAREGQKHSAVWLSELIWRDFFMQILWHFPHVEKLSFRPAFENVKWRESKTEFARWCAGETGYPMVDAGMRELNQTGFMHNRVRMVTASFLTKHLLMHWFNGERYFAEKLLDYDLAANNGNWQWAAGTGCDAAPYFRVFNPTSQQERFDPDFKYIQKWVPEFGTSSYVKPMVDHVFARDRALTEFKRALK